MRIIDQWQGGSTLHNQISYRLIENENGETVLEWRRTEANGEGVELADHDNDYSPVPSVGHRMAKKLADIFLQIDQMSNVVEMKKRSIGGV